MVQRVPLIVSLLPHEFRKGHAPNFAEMAEIVYSQDGTHYCSREDFIEHKDDLDTYFEKRYGNRPDAIVVYEPWDEVLFSILKATEIKVILITEDLHLRPLTLIRTAVNASSLVLARFNIIEEILGEKVPHVRSFPLHCSSVFVSEPNLFSHPKIIHFGNLDTDPPNIDPARSPGANQYAFRKDWHRLLQNKAGENYLHLRLPPEELRQALGRHSFGFSCTYFPYSFSQPCLEEQGEAWAAVNRPHEASKSYLVAKFFEIPGAGLLMLADPTGVEHALADAGFVDGENFVAVSRDNLQSKLNFILNPKNTGDIGEMRQAGYELVKRHHTVEARKRAYRDHVEELLAIHYRKDS